MPTTVRCAQRGFPTVPVIDLSSLASDPPPRPDNPDPWRPGGRGRRGTRKKKKSLFAQQFGDKDLSFFGIESAPMECVSKGPLTLRKDYVEPVCIGGDAMGEERRSHDTGHSAAPEASGIGEGGMGMELGVGEERRSHDTGRSAAPEVSGISEGSVGIELGMGEVSKSDMEKIHKENLEKLSGLSVEEILQEKEQIEKALSMWSNFTLVPCAVFISCF